MLDKLSPKEQEALWRLLQNMEQEALVKKKLW